MLVSGKVSDDERSALKLENPEWRRGKGNEEKNMTPKRIELSYYK